LRQPLYQQVTATDYKTGTTPIALKPQGVLSLIRSVKISTANGQCIVNESGSTFFKNAFDWATQHDTDWLLTEGVSLLSNLPSAGATVLSPNSSVTIGSGNFFLTPAGSTVVVDASSPYNGVDHGFLERSAYLHRNSFATNGAPQSTGVISGFFDIFAGYLHSLFAQMRLPITIQFLVEIQLSCNLRSGSPIGTGQGQSQATVPTIVNDTYAPFMIPSNIPPPLFYLQSSNYTQAQWVYDNLTLSLPVATIVSKMMASPAGLQREIIFQECEQTQLTTSIAPGSNFPSQIAQGVVRPQHLVVFIIPSSASVGSYNSSAPITLDNSFPFSNLNVTVNGQNMFLNAVTNVGRLYDLYAELCPPTADGTQSSMVNEFAFQSSVGAFYAFDLSSVSANLASRNSNSIINFIVNKVNNGVTYDFYPLLVSQRAVTFNISNNSSAISIGTPR